MEINIVKELHPPPATEEEALQRIRQATTLEEFFAASDVAARFDPMDD